MTHIKSAELSYLTVSGTYGNEDIKKALMQTLESLFDKAYWVHIGKPGLEDEVISVSSIVEAFKIIRSDI